MQQLLNTLLQSAPSQPATSDREVAEQTAHALTAAIAAVKDPQLKAALSNALSALHKYVMGVEKEQHQALAGKLAPRVMAQAYGK